MKKRKSASVKLKVCFVFFCLIFALSLFASNCLAAAIEPKINATREEIMVNASASWLYNQVNGKWDALSSEEASWVLLAFSSSDSITSTGKDALIEKGNGECWPASSCRVKSTALASIALNNLGEDMYAATDWILERQRAYTASGVTWILQIDSQDAANCTVKYDDEGSYELIINKNKTYVWRGGSCLSMSSDRYWLSISPSCLDKTFSISCNKEIITSMPYKYSNEFYVPSESNRSSGQINMAIKTLCIKDATSECDYESTLWAAYALYQTGRTEYSPFIPYLVEQYSNHKNIFPEPVLYTLTLKGEYLENMIVLQKRAGYFESDSSSFGRFYDTALAMNSVKDTSNEVKAKIWLINNQSANGDKWGTSEKIRDTAMLIYYGWPDYTLQFSSAGSETSADYSECEDDYSFSCRTRCFTSEERANYSCNSGRRVCCRPKDLPSNECESSFAFLCRTSCVTGEEEANFSCISGLCCKPKDYTAKCTTSADCKKRDCKGEFISEEDSSGVCEYPSETTCNDGFDNDGDGESDYNDNDCTERCSDKGGEICSVSDICSGDTVKSFDSDSCCIGSCTPFSGGTEGSQTCSEQNGYICDENKCSEDWLSASDTGFCCSKECKSGSKLFWIILLILLLGGASFFLYKKGFFDKLKARFKPKSPPAKPGVQMRVYMPPVRPLQPQPHYAQHPARPTMLKKEIKSELDDTMTALRKLAGK